MLICWIVIHLLYSGEWWNIDQTKTIFMFPLNSYCRKIRRIKDHIKYGLVIKIGVLNQLGLGLKEINKLWMEDEAVVCLCLFYRWVATPPWREFCTASLISSNSSGSLEISLRKLHVRSLFPLQNSWYTNPFSLSLFSSFLISHFWPNNVSFHMFDVQVESHKLNWYTFYSLNSLLYA